MAVCLTLVCFNFIRGNTYASAFISSYSYVGNYDCNILQFPMLVFELAATGVFYETKKIYKHRVSIMNKVKILLKSIRSCRKWNTWKGIKPTLSCEQRSFTRSVSSCVNLLRILTLQMELLQKRICVFHSKGLPKLCSFVWYLLTAFSFLIFIRNQPQNILYPLRL